jgi:CHAP domain
MQVRRKIEPSMVKYFDAKLASNGLAQLAIREKDARSLFALAAEACVGIREEGGNNEGPLVDLFQETIGSEGVEPWCMSFVQTCLAYAELRTSKVSPVYATEHCMTCWRETPAIQRTKVSPRRGAIVIWKKGSSDSGHTGIIIEPLSAHYIMVEGNTEAGLSEGKIVRDGGGVYRTKRPKSQVGSMKIVGCLKPF